MHISGNEPSSLILSQTKWYKYDNLDNNNIHYAVFFPVFESKVPSSRVLTYQLLEHIRLHDDI